MASEDWTEFEVILIVADYFKMLQLELAHTPYSKTEHRKALLLLLPNRSNGSIEFKHQNISAVISKLGLPFIKGYKPRFNYQEMLDEEVSKFLVQSRTALEQQFEQFSTELVKDNLPNVNFEVFEQGEPDSNATTFKENEPVYRPIKINYLEKEQNNRLLGEAGERLIIAYEIHRLIKLGKESLVSTIEWVSKEQGDGTGFDILSKNGDGSDRYIEVKTTKLSKESPIYFTKTELSFAASHASSFYLYRVYNFNTDPKAFIKNGKYQDFCTPVSQTFKGYF